MAEFYMNDLAERAGLRDELFAASAAVPTVFMAKNNTNGLINLFMMSPIC